MPKSAVTIWADGPSSVPYEPVKADIREWGTWFEGIINAFLGNGGLVYASRASLFADLAHGPNSSAWVIGDGTVAYNGVYVKTGASGSGSWTRIADLPYSFIIAADTGAGTPNAIQASSSIPISSSALVVTNVFEANTGSPVTIQFNGGPVLTIKTNSGNNVSAGGLVSGMLISGYVSGATFRLVSDQVSTAVVAAAEAAAAQAESLIGKAENSVQYTAKSGDTNVQLQAAINAVASGSRRKMVIPPGTYSLAADVTPNGRIVSWDISPEAVFTGSGKITLDYTNSSANWKPSNTQTTRQSGQIGAPVNTKSPVALFRKVHTTIDSADPGYSPNSALMVTMRKDSGEGFSSSNSALFVETVDGFGNPTTTGPKGFTEGLRVSSYVTNGATHALPYGAIIGAGNEAGTTVDIMVGLECDVALSDTDAPTLSSFTTASSYVVPYNSTSSGSKRPIAYYGTNPFDWVPEPVRPRAAFAALGPVNESVFAYVDRTYGTPVGLDFRWGKLPYAGIALGNGQRVMWRNAADNNDVSVMYLDTGNNLVIGQGLLATGRVLLQVYNQVNSQMELRKLEVDASNNLKALPI